MRIGVAKEIKANEQRVGLTPDGVRRLVEAGHLVRVEAQAGLGSGFTDQAYEAAGAEIVDSAAEAWDVDLLVKVKEPQVSEYQYFKEGLILFTYLHLAPAADLTQAILDGGLTTIGYESIEVDGQLPLLQPMSQIAGSMAVQMGAQYLFKNNGGKGVLLAGINSVEPSKVTIIGGGVAGTSAIDTALALGSAVTVLELDTKRIEELKTIYQGQALEVLASNPTNIEAAVKDADLVVGAVLIPGAKAPTLVTNEMVQAMEAGSVIVDIAIDQGGIFESNDQVGTLDDPVIMKHDVIHYAVANMPGAVPRTATMALTNSTVPYILEIADQGIEAVIKSNPAIRYGINTYEGTLTLEEVAEAQGLTHTPIDKLIDWKR